MNNLAVGVKALKKIIDELKSLSSVFASLKDEFNLSSKDEETLKRTVHGALKHYYLLSFQAKDAFKDVKDNTPELYLLVLALYQIRYCQKTIAPFRTIEDGIKANEDLLLSFSPEELKTKLEALASSPYKIPAEVMKDPYKYNALFFSVPEWIIRMWAEQYGDEIAMALLRATQGHKQVYVRLNHQKMTEDELLDEGVYENSQFAKDAYVYHAALPFSQTDDYKNGKAFIEDLSLQIVSESLNLAGVINAGQLFSSTGSFSASLGLRLKEQGGNLLAYYPDELTYRRGKYFYQRLSLNETKAVLCLKGEEEKVLSSSPLFDLLVIAPPSSSLGLIAKNPALLSLLKEEEMPKITSEELSLLSLGSSRLNKGGFLVYLVKTINKKEGEELVQKFVKENPEFVIETSKQIFPYDYSSDGLYYAVIRKIGK
ncbi:MAG: hypothetical protein LKJ88_08215 [Bacilli bacterium]|jgi:16S rRNA (cytosine967-C5)-methyltransferase|nr:hypothetical protein [Bacilli bacterium]